jgi:hypothetical protein
MHHAALKSHKALGCGTHKTLTVMPNAEEGALRVAMAKCGDQAGYRKRFSGIEMHATGEHYFFELSFGDVCQCGACTGEKCAVG